MSRFIKILLGAMVALLGFSCNVHEWPEPGDPIELRLKLDFDTDLPQYMVIEHTLNSRASTSPYAYDVRYIVGIHELYSIDSDDYNTTPSYTYVYTKDDVDELNYETMLTLPSGMWKIVVWADFVEQDSQDDKFYDTSNLAEITIKGAHEGNNDFRDAFVGYQNVMIPVQENSAGYVIDAVVPMERPLAKFNFISTDLQAFLTRVLSIRAQKMSKDETLTPEQLEELYSQLKPSSVDYSEFRVVFNYVGFMPHVFDLYRNRPIDALTGVTFDSSLRVISDDEAELGFDYVFVNGNESAVTLILQTYDKDGTLVSQTSDIRVPIVRSKLTTVRGQLLTRIASGNVGIDPGFVDEYNYYWNY